MWCVIKPSKKEKNLSDLFNLFQVLSSNYGYAEVPESKKSKQIQNKTKQNSNCCKCKYH